MFVALAAKSDLLADKVQADKGRNIHSPSTQADAAASSRRRNGPGFSPARTRTPAKPTNVRGWDTFRPDLTPHPGQRRASDAILASAVILGGLATWKAAPCLSTHPH